MKTLKTIAATAAITSGLMLWVAATSQQGSMQMGGKDTGEHAMFTLEDCKWMDAPASLPKGAQVAILEGNPAGAGAFTMRIKVPANFTVPPHWHPADEHATIISGTFYMGMGEKFDESKLRVLGPGSFAMMKMGTRHFARSGSTECIVQVHGIGPWGINYVNPLDDPRNIK